MNRYFAIVPAAGSGARFGAAIPKQYLPLHGHPVLFHTLARLCACAELVRVIVVLAPEDTLWASESDWPMLGERLVPIRTGGENRAASVRAGLAALAGEASPDDWVLVHDAARPCLTAATLQRLIGELRDDDVGGLLAVRVADTLKRDGGTGRVTATEPREGLWQAQTPQMFRYGLLTRALDAAGTVTDEAGAIEALGLAPKLVEGDVGNLKITYPADLELAGRILQRSER